MTDKGRKLLDVAFDVADAYRAGLFSHLKGNDWHDTWLSLLTELKQRCPGFTDIEYQRALDRGFLDSR